MGVAGSLMRLGGLVMTDGVRSLWVLDDVLVSEEELVCCVSCESFGPSWGEFCEVGAFSQWGFSVGCEGGDSWRDCIGELLF